MKKKFKSWVGKEIPRRKSEKTNELKTLKDLKKVIRTIIGTIATPYELTKKRTEVLVNDEELKAEALKHIKNFRDINFKDERINKKDVDVRGVQLGANYLIQEWIKYFFNLTEEDLK